jgi:hypothetical protein
MGNVEWGMWKDEFTHSAACGTGRGQMPFPIPHSPLASHHFPCRGVERQAAGELGQRLHDG